MSQDQLNRDLGRQLLDEVRRHTPKIQQALSRLTDDPADERLRDTLLHGDLVPALELADQIIFGFPVSAPRAAAKARSRRPTPYPAPRTRARSRASRGRPVRRRGSRRSIARAGPDDGDPEPAGPLDRQATLSSEAREFIRELAQRGGAADWDDVFEAVIAHHRFDRVRLFNAYREATAAGRIRVHDPENVVELVELAP